MKTFIVTETLPLVTAGIHFLISNLLTIKSFTQARQIQRHVQSTTYYYVRIYWITKHEPNQELSVELFVPFVSGGFGGLYV